jgi:hypothetical protein
MHSKQSVRGFVAHAIFAALTVGTVLWGTTNNAIAAFDIDISNSPTTDVSTSTNGSSTTFSPTQENANLNVTDLENALANGPTTVTTGTQGSVTTAGISVLNAVVWSANTLTLDAYESIYVYYKLAASSTAGLALVINDGGSGGNLFFSLSGRVTFENTNEPLTINGVSYTLVSTIGTLISDIGLPNGAAGS